MKHNIRQKILDPVRGLVTKVISVDGELGSGITDRHGVEIFEGDIVEYRIERYVVSFHNGKFLAGAAKLDTFDRDAVEVVGHVD